MRHFLPAAAKSPREKSFKNIAKLLEIDLRDNLRVHSSAIYYVQTTAKCISTSRLATTKLAGAANSVEESPRTRKELQISV
jgi:hypothetical protein